MPFSTPEVADSTNSPVTTRMMTTVIWLFFGTSRRYCRPLLSWSPLRPRAVAVPNRVATMARASMILPMGVWLAFSPSTGVNVALTRTGSPLRNEKYAIAPPMIA